MSYIAALGEYIYTLLDFELSYKFDLKLLMVSCRSHGVFRGTCFMNFFG